jgi:DNA-binding NarL/FixJ family response regulator
MISVLVVDDQKTIQQFLKAALEAEPDLNIVGVANDGKEAIEKVEQLRPDVVVMDINMPVMDGLAATRLISDRYTATRVLILSLYDDDEYLSDALEAGAKGYLFKNTPSEDIIIAVRSVYKGYFQLGPGLLEKYLYKLAMTSRIYTEINRKINETTNIIDKNKNVGFMMNDVIRNITDLEKRFSILRNIVYVILFVNFFILLLAVFLS